MEPVSRQRLTIAKKPSLVLYSSAGRRNTVVFNIINNAILLSGDRILKPMMTRSSPGGGTIQSSDLQLKSAFGYEYSNR